MLLTEDSSLICKKGLKHWVFSFNLWSIELRALILICSCSGQAISTQTLFSRDEARLPRCTEHAWWTSPQKTGCRRYTRSGYLRMQAGLCLMARIGANCSDARHTS